MTKGDKMVINKINLSIRNVPDHLRTEVLEQPPSSRRSGGLNGFKMEPKQGPLQLCILKRLSPSLI